MTKNIFADQDQGSRDYQEDAWQFIEPQNQEDGLLMIVCDGMGGHAGGKQASNGVINIFLETFRKTSDFAIDDRLKNSLEAAHHALLDQISETPELSGMGTTLLATYIYQQELHWISVGDSPLFLVRDGEITRLNDDHSMLPVLEKMIVDGLITQEEFETDPRRNMLRSAVSDGEIKHIDLQQRPLEPRDILLLTSDGIETLSPEQICQISLDHIESGAKPICRQLIKSVLAQQKPAQDNITTISYIHDFHTIKKAPFLSRLLKYFK